MYTDAETEEIVERAARRLRKLCTWCPTASAVDITEAGNPSKIEEVPLVEGGTVLLQQVDGRPLLQDEPVPKVRDQYAIILFLVNSNYKTYVCAN